MSCFRVLAVLGVALLAVPAIAAWNPQADALAQAKWSFDPGGYWGFRSGPTLADGHIYAAALDGGIRRFSRTGEVDLLVRLPARVTFSRPAVARQRVYVGCEDKGLYCIDARTKRIDWSFLTAGRIEGSPVVAVGRVYVGSTDKHLYAFDAESGRLLWKLKSDGRIGCRPLVHGGRVFFGSEDPTGKTFYAVDTKTGRVVYGIDTARAVYSSPAAYRDTVIFGCMDGHVYAVDAADGKVRWKHACGGPVPGSPAVADGIVVIASQDGRINALEASDGRPRWALETRFDWQRDPNWPADRPAKLYYPNLATPSIDRGRVYIPVAYAVLCLDLSSGELLHSYLMENPIDAPSVALDEEFLYVCTRRGLRCFRLIEKGGQP